MSPASAHRHVEAIAALPLSSLHSAEIMATKERSCTSSKSKSLTLAAAPLLGRGRGSLLHCSNVLGKRPAVHVRSHAYTRVHTADHATVFFSHVSARFRLEIRERRSEKKTRAKFARRLMGQRMRQPNDDVKMYVRIVTYIACAAMPAPALAFFEGNFSTFCRGTFSLT